MSFISIEFVLFFIPVLIIFLVLKGVWQKRFLAFASVVFIGLISIKFMVYALLISTINFGLAQRIERNRKGEKVTTVYYAGQILNIGGLIIYKYLGFIFDNVNLIFKFNVPDDFFTLAVPLGISYYTFQSISYLYLVWKAGDKSEKVFSEFILYMLFFPKFLAGPIERHRKFLPQLKTNNLSKGREVKEGLRLILWGAFKKVMLGDTLGIVINKVYADVEGFSALPLWLTFLIQPMQIYGDFSGYTDMAIGLAKLLGIQLSPNFNRPFFAKSVGQYWKRWHISLSSWCNDFIYNRLMLKYRRRGNVAILYALFVTFMIIGIWHGAKWTFVIIGFLQVLALTYEFYSKKWRMHLFNRIPTEVGNIVSYALVYLFSAFFHIFFYSNNLSDALAFISGLFNFSQISLSWGLNIPHFDFALALLTIVFVLSYEYLTEKGKDVSAWFFRWPVALRWSVYYLSIFVTFHFAKNALFFIYADF
ncbi:MBOAT family O-acyltransferase [Carboxylicivirga linearis]|uniref:MBOAT family protein n=1 Tax=Carboxylicivirga linearis TaxID=1628157 RepID=A0ABS5JVY0_9BACT|nr:MBOAT family protein [Carboxylicivirga linearis]MBS2099062.1 MBOAT family protein [Carboxylicivirga linearis]